MQVIPKLGKNPRSIWHTDIREIVSGKKRILPTKDLAVFCRQTAFLLDAGLPLNEVMPLLADQTRMRIVSNLHSLILQGESFSNALRTTGSFPAFMCAYVAIGEGTANLPGVFLRLADYFETRAKAHEELRAAMLYPCVVSVMMLGVIVLAVTFVLPGYAQMFDAADVSLPVATALLLAGAGFIAANILPLSLIAAVAVLVAAIFFSQPKGRFFAASVALKIPIFRLSINYNFAQGLSLLLDPGLSVSDALPLCSETIGNPIVREDLKKLSAAVKSGVPFWTGISKLPYISPLFISLARSGENTGDLPQALQKCSMYFSEAYRQKIRHINKLLVPLMTLTIGLILAAVMLAVILPAFELAAVF